jgi:hypothetical protein
LLKQKQGCGNRVGSLTTLLV